MLALEPIRRTSCSSAHLRVRTQTHSHVPTEQISDRFRITSGLSARSLEDSFFRRNTPTIGLEELSVSLSFWIVARSDMVSV